MRRYRAAVGARQRGGAAFGGLVLQLLAHCIQLASPAIGASATPPSKRTLRVQVLDVLHALPHRPHWDRLAPALVVARYA